MMGGESYERGAGTRDRLGELRTAISADEWALEQALRAYRAAPDDDARAAAVRRIDEQVGFINAEVFGIRKEGSDGEVS